jgi:hypothetical protein
MVQPHYNVYGETQEIIKKLNYNKYLFKEELKKRTEISRAITPQHKNAGKQYMLNMNNILIQEEIRRITQEFVRKARI